MVMKAVGRDEQMGQGSLIVPTGNDSLCIAHPRKGLFMAKGRNLCLEAPRMLSSHIQATQGPPAGNPGI